MTEVTNEEPVFDDEMHVPPAPTPPTPPPVDTQPVTNSAAKMPLQPIKDPNSQTVAEHTPTIALPTVTYERLVKALSVIENIGVRIEDMPAEWWSEVLNARAILDHSETSPTPNTENPNRLWNNQLEVTDEDGKIKIIKPTSRKASATVINEAVVDMLFGEVMHTGETITVPLYHTGIHVTFKPPLLKSFTAIQAKINTAMYEYFKKTWGLRFSGSVHVRTQEYVHFALAHVTASSLKDTGNLTSQLLSVIHPFDIPHLLAGFAQTFRPSGVAVSLPCMNKVGECSHVVEGTINIADTMVVDTRALTPEQRLHIAKRGNKVHDHKSVAAYKDAFNRHHVVALNDDISITVNGNLTLDTYFDTINGFVELCDTFIAELGDSDNIDREDVVNRFVASIEVMTYASWVAGVTIKRAGGELVTITKPTTMIHRALQNLSSGKGMFKTFVSTMNDYFNKHTISHVAVESYRCPACGTVHEENLSDTLTSLVAINPIRFFSELIQREQQRLDTMV